MGEFLIISRPIYGLIFLFKWTETKEPRETLLAYDQNLFFANQVLSNACATQAILSVLLNRKEIEIGDELKNLQSFSKDLDSKDKGFAIGNSEIIRNAHNSFARQDPFDIEDDKKATGTEDVFHFISYVPHNNVLYELDGLQKGPISHGECSNDTWLALAKEQIQQRMEKFAETEIRFNILAICADKKMKAEEEMARDSALARFIAPKVNCDVPSQVI
jgi:ubiquitin carboxyl-terminal hydrolase L5